MCAAWAMHLGNEICALRKLCNKDATAGLLATFLDFVLADLVCLAAIDQYLPRPRHCVLTGITPSNPAEYHLHGIHAGSNGQAE